MLRGGGVLLAAALLTGLPMMPCAQPAAPAADAASASMPAAHWDGPGVQIDVHLGRDATAGTEPMAALAHYAIGIVAMPMVVLEPAAALGWPIYMLVGAPWQAAFNSRSRIAARALAAEPLPTAVVAALREQWPTNAPPALRLELRIAGYGLATRSGRTLEAFAAQEDLCLVADTQLEVTQDGRPPRSEALTIGVGSSSVGAPPAVCAPLSRWAADDGRLVRQSVAELAELLAALVLQQVGSAP